MAATLRLYYDHPALQSFDATVVRSEARDGRAAVWLDRTAFYPSSGGQPFDEGTLGGLPVVDVQDDEAGDVCHVLDGVAPAAGTLLTGEVAWARRVDHMQQHTGQHLLSAVIERAAGAKTISFHLGSGSSTIDLDRELTPSQLAAVEREANEVIASDVEVSVSYASEDDARALPLRKESARTGVLRLVEIAGLDLSACGGTHVARTGAIGQLIVASTERVKGGQRLEFLCGGRALARHQQLRDMAAASIRLLSVLPADLPSAIERLQAEAKEQRRTILSLQGALAGYEAQAMAAAAEPYGSARLVLQEVDGDAVRLKQLASAIVGQPGVVAVLISRTSPVLAVAARSADVTTPCNDVIGALAKQFGGRGGGKPDLAQCGSLQADAAAVLAAARTLLEAARPA